MTADDSLRGTFVLFAVDREARALQRVWPATDTTLHLGITGVGRHAAGAYLASLLERGSTPSRIIVAGFAGALREDLPLAKVLVASEVVDERGNRWTTQWPERGDEGKRPFRVLTCDQMVGDPVRKRELGAKHAADCVEMESAAIAEICHQHGIPFGCVRVISDDVNKPLSPRLLKLVKSGRVSIPRVLWEIARSPSLAVELVRLAKDTRKAADALANRLRQLLSGNPGL